MKNCLFLALFFLLARPLGAQTEDCAEPKPVTSEVSQAVCLFSKPLLVGASITTGYGANSGGPAALIAKTLSPGSEISNIARGGTPSVVSLRNHQIPDIHPSVVMGVDLFFWDAARKNCGEDFETKTKSFIKLYQDKKIPMILGKLPMGVKFPTGYAVLNETDCTGKINKLLESECTPEKNCLLYDPMVCIDKLRKANPSEEKLKKYFVDDLHTSEEGNRYCADVFIAAKAYKNLTCPSLK